MTMTHAPHAATSIDALRVTRPRILAARRTDLRTYTVGDEAIVEFGPGLLQFLQLKRGEGPILGVGGAFEWTIPIGAAGTAAYAVVEPEGFADVNSWTGITNIVHWVRACSADETLIATCRLSELGRYARLPYRTYSSTHGDLLVSGEFVFASVAGDADGLYTIDPRRTPDAPVPKRAPSTATKHHVREQPAPGPAAVMHPSDAIPDWSTLDLWSDSAPAFMQGPEPIAPDLFSLRCPEVVRRYKNMSNAEIWEWLFPRDLLRLLGNPLSGAKEPLGRRHHPFGRILEGMAIHAARAMSGGADPRTLEIRWSSPTRGDEDFRIRSTVIADSPDGMVSRHDIYEGEREVGTVTVKTQGKDASGVD